MSVQLMIARQPSVCQQQQLSSVLIAKTTQKNSLRPDNQSKLTQALSPDPLQPIRIERDSMQTTHSTLDTIYSIDDILYTICVYHTF